MTYLFKITYNSQTISDLSRKLNIEYAEMMKNDLISVAKDYVWNIELEDFNIEEIGQSLSVGDAENKEYIVDCGIDKEKDEYFIKLSEIE